MDCFSISWNELGRFECLRYHHGYLGFPLVRIPTIARKIRRIDGRVEYFFRGTKYSRQWKLISVRHSDFRAACDYGAGSHDDWHNKII